MESLSCVYDTRTTLPADTFTRSGYSFVEWNTEADGSGTAYPDKASVLNLTVDNKATVSLYAQWKNNYSVTEGAKAIVSRDGTSGITFKVDGDYNKFTGIAIDGQNVPANQYTSWAGSTYVRLNQEYINQTEAGIHNIKFNFTDGSVETTFDVITGPPAQKGHSGNLLLWIIIIVIVLALAACTAVILLRRRRRS